MAEGSAHISERCLYTQLENGIHLFVLKQANQQALDECFEQVAILYRSASPETPLRLIIDLRAVDLPPLLRVAFHVVRLKRLTTARQPRKIAFVYSEESRASTLHHGISWVLQPRRYKVRFFPHTQWEMANEWLLEAAPN